MIDGWGQHGHQNLTGGPQGARQMMPQNPVNHAAQTSERAPLMQNHTAHGMQRFGRPEPNQACWRSDVRYVEQQHAMYGPAPMKTRRIDHEFPQYPGAATDMPVPQHGSLSNYQGNPNYAPTSNVPSSVTVNPRKTAPPTQTQAPRYHAASSEIPGSPRRKHPRGVVENARAPPRYGYRVQAPAHYHGAESVAPRPDLYSYPASRMQTWMPGMPQPAPISRFPASISSQAPYYDYNGLSMNRPPVTAHLGNVYPHQFSSYDYPRGNSANYETWPMVPPPGNSYNAPGVWTSPDSAVDETSGTHPSSSMSYDPYYGHQRSMLPPTFRHSDSVETVLSSQSADSYGSQSHTSDPYGTPTPSPAHSAGDDASHNTRSVEQDSTTAVPGSIDSLGASGPTSTTAEKSDVASSTTVHISKSVESAPKEPPFDSSGTGAAPGSMPVSRFNAIPANVGGSQPPVRAPQRYQHPLPMPMQAPMQAAPQGVLPYAAPVPFLQTQRSAGSQNGFRYYRLVTKDGRTILLRTTNNTTYELMGATAQPQIAAHNTVASNYPPAQQTATHFDTQSQTPLYEYSNHGQLSIDHTMAPGHSLGTQYPGFLPEASHHANQAAVEQTPTSVDMGSQVFTVQSEAAVPQVEAQQMSTTAQSVPSSVPAACVAETQPSMAPIPGSLAAPSQVLQAQKSLVVQVEQHSAPGEPPDKNQTSETLQNLESSATSNSENSTAQASARSVPGKRWKPKRTRTKATSRETTQSSGGGKPAGGEPAESTSRKQSPKAKLGKVKQPIPAAPVPEPETPVIEQEPDSASTVSGGPMQSPPVEGTQGSGPQAESESRPETTPNGLADQGISPDEIALIENFLMSDSIDFKDYKDGEQTQDVPECGESSEQSSTPTQTISQDDLPDELPISKSSAQNSTLEESVPPSGQSPATEKSSLPQQYSTFLDEDIWAAIQREAGQLAVPSSEGLTGDSQPVVSKSESRERA